MRDAAQSIASVVAAAHHPAQLDAAASLLWRGYGVGQVNDDEAAYLSAAIEARRPRKAVPAVYALPGTTTRIVSRFAPRQRPRSPDRKASRDRRRMLGGSSALPDTLRHHYTEGQRAVLCVVAGEVKRHERCDLPVDRIAALAGVCATTVQTTIHEAVRLAHLVRTERGVKGRKNLTNVLEIVSREWWAWLERSGIGSKILNLVSPTKNPLIHDDVLHARDCASDEAARLAIEIARLSGYDLDDLPTAWQDSKPAQTVQRWLTALAPYGVSGRDLRSMAHHVVQRMVGDRPRTINYFTPEVRKIADRCVRAARGTRSSS